jgi:TonB dependent receptor/CarboxypepD_reg-like domain/TonB-dependent Receptor Plug Domain
MHKPDFYFAKKTTYFLLIFMLFISLKITAQSVMSGYVLDEKSHEPLIGAVLFDSINQTGVTTNEYGYYRFFIQNSTINLRISYIGYQAQNLTFVSTAKDIISTIYLTPSLSLATVTIIGNRDDNVETIQAGKVNVPLERLQNIPSIGGERDLLKALSVLPGVANGAEGTSSLLVRGGGQDQNQFVLDGANVYNTGHLLNFISIFNPDALKKVDFYKGGFPARFGGRLSSVMDVTFREGNKQKFQGNIDVGLINSKLTLEGPIGKTGKTSYLFAARTTYLDLVQFLIGNSPSAVRKNKIQSYTGYTFFDINAKITHEFNDKNKLYISYYEGLDYVRFMNKESFARTFSDFSNATSNRTISTRYYKVLKPTFSMNMGINYSYNGAKFEEYKLSQFDKTDKGVPVYDELNGNGGNFLNDVSAFLKFDYSPNAYHFLRFGLESTVHRYQAHTSDSQNRSYALDSTIFNFKTQISNPILRGYETAAFIEDEISFNKNVSINAGIRLSSFRSDNTTYTNFEPRFALRYSIPNWFTINATAAQTVQYSHALLSNEIGLDKLIWVPSSSNLLPQKANQISLGFAKQLKKWNVDVSVEGYYKYMKNLSQFIFYNDFGGNIYQNWAQNILKNGKGEAYGLEFLINKTEGKFNGMISYTHSWNNRQFDGFNESKAFPFKYDRRNILNIYGSYQLTKGWKIGALWTYNTGFRITVPNGQIVDVPFFEEKKLLYTSVNNAKMPDYHRLDLNAIHEKKLKNGRTRTWSINLYNAYARLNPIYIFVKKGYTEPVTKVVTPDALKGIVLLPFLPSVNYALKF